MVTDTPEGCPYGVEHPGKTGPWWAESHCHRGNLGMILSWGGSAKRRFAFGDKKKGTNEMNEFTLDKFLGRHGAVSQRSEPGEGMAPAVAGSSPARAARAHTLCP